MVLETLQPQEPVELGVWFFSLVGGYWWKQEIDTVD